MLHRDNNKKRSEQGIGEKKRNGEKGFSPNQKIAQGSGRRVAPKAAGGAAGDGCIVVHFPRRGTSRHRRMSERRITRETKIAGGASCSCGRQPILLVEIV
jgi:hypothetical protein